ncbi:MAG: membrane protein of unknown function [Promethearchaeota archaeon]|nr:MAG: membrane protein of unknown function [Candidatus Lokiarchaeota archaeon]
MALSNEDIIELYLTFNTTESGLEIIEFVSWIMMSVGIVIYAISMFYQKGLIKYFPGIFSLWFVFLFTNTEAIFLNMSAALNTLEHLFVLISGAFFALGAAYEYYTIYLKSSGNVGGV